MRKRSAMIALRFVSLTTYLTSYPVISCGCSHVSSCATAQLGHLLPHADKYRVSRAGHCGRVTLAPLSPAPFASAAALQSYAANPGSACAADQHAAAGVSNRRACYAAQMACPAWYRTQGHCLANYSPRTTSVAIAV